MANAELSVVGRDQVVTAIADALGCVLYGRSDRAEQLVHYLRDKAVLLILDNFEHLLAEATCYLSHKDQTLDKYVRSRTSFFKRIVVIA